MWRCFSSVSVNWLTLLVNDTAADAVVAPRLPATPKALSATGAMRADVDIIAAIEGALFLQKCRLAHHFVSFANRPSFRSSQTPL
jgi:hypothetical protein